MTINFPPGVLFCDPRSNQRIPLAQLAFFLPGTETPLAVYQDGARTTPWTQPILADANGNFPPNIYLDPSGPVFLTKVRLSNAAGVQQWVLNTLAVPSALTVDSATLHLGSAAGDIVVTPSPVGQSTSSVQITPRPRQSAIRLVGGGLLPGGSVQPAWQINNATTGTRTASFAAASNKPGPGPSSPVKWLPILYQGVTYYTPCFL